jgi:dTDP-4-dehydrorhamnose 3,5-epimerase
MQGIRMFKNGKIHDVVIRDLAKFVDDRGWLTELYRKDEIPEQFVPVMAYISLTLPDVARGPHEHVEQADYFGFIGPSDFKIFLWDNRPASPTYMVRQIVYAGENVPRTVIIPPGVVHAYKNAGGKTGMVINLPNALYAGKGKKQPVDEIRHETDPHSAFLLE